MLLHFMYLISTHRNSWYSIICTFNIYLECFLIIFLGFCNINNQNMIFIVLEILGDMGEILLGLNMKSLADNWIGYMTLVEKQENILSSNFNIAKPINFLSKEICKNMQTVMCKVIYSNGNWGKNSLFLF